MDFTLPEWLALAGVILFSGIVQSALGFGFALVAMSMLPFFIDVKTANLIVSFAAVAPIAVAAWSYRKELQRTSLNLTLTGALIGLPLGLAVLVYAIDDYLVRFTGAVILFMALDGLLRKPVEKNANPPAKHWAILAGAASGFLGGAATIGGPPVAVFAARQPWSPQQMKAFLTTFLLLTSVVKLAGLSTTGLINQTVLILSALAIPIGFIGGKLGVVISEKIPTRHFRILTLTMLGLIATIMILRGA